MKFKIPIIVPLAKITIKLIKIVAKVAIRTYGLEDEVEDLKNIVVDELDKIKKNNKDTVPKKEKKKRKKKVK
jgi:hypothetical protein